MQLHGGIRIYSLLAVRHTALLPPIRTRVPKRLTIRRLNLGNSKFPNDLLGWMKFSSQSVSPLLNPDSVVETFSGGRSVRSHFLFLSFLGVGPSF